MRVSWLLTSAGFVPAAGTPIQAQENVEDLIPVPSEMVRNIENTAAMARKTRDISDNLKKVADDGGAAVKNSIQSIREVSDYSQQILKLLGLISNIAKQTNLLAMNAAIEAAHAGDAGKGFAIVADEIRRLSEDTNKNARDIGDVVSSIISRIEDSVRLSEKAGIGLDMITAYSGQNSVIIAQLNTAMGEQNHGAKEILISTQEMVKITEEVKLTMKEQTESAGEISRSVIELKDMAVDNQETIGSHLANLNSLIRSQDELQKIMAANQQTAERLYGIVAKFTLDKENSPESTALKLVE